MKEEVFFEESRLDMGTVLFKLFSYILFNIFVAYIRGSKCCVSFFLYFSIFCYLSKESHHVSCVYIPRDYE